MYVHGYLFLNYEGTRLLFISDGLAVEETLDWQVLLRGDCLERFVEEFKAVPTREGPLRGWRVDANVTVVHLWLDKCLLASPEPTENASRLRRGGEFTQAQNQTI